MIHFLERNDKAIKVVFLILCIIGSVLCSYYDNTEKCERRGGHIITWLLCVSKGRILE